MNRGPTTRALHRFSARRAWGAALGWIDDNDAARSLPFFALFVVAIGTLLLVVTSGGRQEEGPGIPRFAPPDGERVRSVVNPAGGYEFSVPASWHVRVEGPQTLVQSPDGRIVLTFGLGASGDIEHAATLLLASLNEAHAERELIGRAREQIGGSRALLVSGVAANQKRGSVRFLAITVRAQPRNYAITISVPVGSDPARVLPRLERIVTSFAIVGYGRTDRF